MAGAEQCQAIPAPVLCSLSESSEMMPNKRDPPSKLLDGARQQPRAPEEDEVTTYHKPATLHA